ncbi:hypothetical protein K9L05_03480, partial [Candidatus Babeliales bacterium]|nr:hypothetical protein [Candidatus Babeliales bacterium]
PIHNPNNIWKISLVDPRKKIDKALRYPRVTRSQNPNAMAQSGLNGLFWISIKDDFILVGSGYQPGQNIILSRKLPEKFLGKINYMGFSSNKLYASYTNILTGNPIDIKQSNKIYKETGESISSSGDFSWLANFPLRSSHKGSIITNIKADKNAQIAFSSSPDNAGIKYVLEIGGQNNQTISISKKIKNKLQEQYKVYLPQVITKENNLFQISVDDGLFLVTRNKKLLFAWQDPKAPIDVEYNVIGFGAKDSSAEFSNIKIAASIKLEYRRTEKEYKQILSGFTQSYMLPFLLISPFEYWLQQVRNSIRIIDPIYNPVGWDVFDMPEAGAHFLRVTIEGTGQPRFDKAEDSKGHLAEHIINIGCDTLGNIGQRLTQSAGKDQAAAQQAGSQEEAVALKAGSAKKAVVGAISSITANLTQKIVAKVFEPTTGIYTEQTVAATASGKTNEAINQSSQLIQQYFDQIDNLEKETAGFGGGADPEKQVANFLIKINLSNRIIDNMISSENVSRENRNRMLRNLDSLFNESKNQPPSAYLPLISLFVKAYDNRFLLNPENPKFDGLRGELYTKRNMLARRLFAGLANNAIEEIEIQASHGEPVWFDKELPEPNKGSIFFEGSGPGNIIIVFHNKTDRIRKMQEATDLILVNIGAFDNTKTVICSDSNMQVESFVTAEQEPNAIANEVNFRKYIVSYNNGKVIFGIIKDDGSIKEVLSWQDKYPLKNIKYVGFSSWDAPIKLKNIKIGPPIEEMGKQKIQKQK